MRKEESLEQRVLSKWVGEKVNLTPCITPYTKMNSNGSET